MKRKTSFRAPSGTVGRNAVTILIRVRPAFGRKVAAAARRKGKSISEFGRSVLKEHVR
jgi:hypothetical protein